MTVIQSVIDTVRRGTHRLSLLLRQLVGQRYDELSVTLALVVREGQYAGQVVTGGTVLLLLINSQGRGRDQG